MQIYIDFLKTHWLLTTAFIALALLIFIIEKLSKTLGPKSITPQEAIFLINREKAIVLDIRVKENYQQGHIVQAISLPFSNEKRFLEQLTTIAPIPQKQSIIVVCESRDQAIKVNKILERLEFKSVNILRDGMSAWLTAGLPTD
jgi:rhodanese-related sulfurtransferase